MCPINTYGPFFSRQAKFNACKPSIFYIWNCRAIGGVFLYCSWISSTLMCVSSKAHNKQRQADALRRGFERYKVK